MGTSGVERKGVSEGTESGSSGDVALLLGKVVLSKPSTSERYSWSCLWEEIKYVPIMNVHIDCLSLLRAWSLHIRVECLKLEEDECREDFRRIRSTLVLARSGKIQELTPHVL